MSPTYDIEILYREPTYEIRHPGRKEPFSWTYRITASSPDVALDAALARFQDMAANSWVSWVRNVVDIRVQPTSPHALELDFTEQGPVLSEPDGEKILLDEQSRSVLLHIQDQLVEELLIILWTHFRDTYLRGRRSRQEESKLYRALKELDRVKLWEWNSLYDRVAAHYRESTAPTRHLKLSIDQQDFGSVRAAWKAFFLEELEALGRSGDFVTPVLTLATSCEPAKAEQARRAVEDHLEARYASRPEPATTDWEEAPLFGALSRFLRSMKKKAEARWELERVLRGLDDTDESHE